jgi:MoaD family protein
MVRVRFFASIKEKVGKSEIEAYISGSETVGVLMGRIANEYEVKREVLINDTLLYAVNHNHVKSDYLLKDGDEVAVLPPLSGG